MLRSTSLAKWQLGGYILLRSLQLDAGYISREVADQKPHTSHDTLQITISQSRTSHFIHTRGVTSLVEELSAHEYFHSAKFA